MVTATASTPTKPWEEEVRRLRPPEYDLEAVRFGRCVHYDDGSPRKMRHTIAHPEIVDALPPIATSPLVLRVPSLAEHPTVALGAIELPSEAFVEIACFLGAADDLDALAATSRALRAVARSVSPMESLLTPWISPAGDCWAWARNHCPRSVSRTFQRISEASNHCPFGWDAVLWQSSALGCNYGVLLALEHGARVNEYSGGRQNQEGPALWCAAKFNHLDTVRLLCEKGGADLEARGGIITHSSPLWVAAREGNSSVMSYLMEKGADPASRSHEGLGYEVGEIVMRRSYWLMLNQ